MKNILKRLFFLLLAITAIHIQAQTTKPDKAENLNSISAAADAGDKVSIVNSTGDVLIDINDETAGGFYAEHQGKGFYGDLIEFMTSGPVMVQVLEGENAVALNRELMGATNPAEAEPGTIRADYANSIDANAVHGSDSLQSAEREVSYFFNDGEICDR